MNIKEPINQTKLLGLDKFIHELINLDKKNILPNKILLSGPKGIGKATLAYHFINYVLSKHEEFSYDVKNLEINTKNSTYKTISNKSNPNFILIDVNTEKKSIDIEQIRSLISQLNKSSFNDKPRFVLIDNIELLNVNSVNALLKIIEEPTFNVHFILIKNNKKILQTLASRCINIKISLKNDEMLHITEKLLDTKLNLIINKNLISYYLTPGNIFKLIKFAQDNSYDLSKLELREFLKILINNNHYRNDNLIKYLIYDFVELFFTKLDTSNYPQIYDIYSDFIKKISDTKKFNLDEESLFIEFENRILNG